MSMKDVGPTALRVEGERPADGAIERVLDPLEGAFPATGENGWLDQSIRAIHKRRLSGQNECRIDDATDVRAGNVELARTCPQLFAKTSRLCSQVELCSQWRRGRLRSERVLEEGSAEHARLHGTSKHRIDAAEVLSFLGNLLGYSA
jgi:hypothetical protein